MLIRNNKFLSYCTNIHPAESWSDTYQSLKDHLPQIKSKVSPNQDFGLGLRLSNQAVNELLLNDTYKEFDQWLEENSVKIMSVNGFPFGEFHQYKVKENVHSPDWFTEERRIYTYHIVKLLSLMKNTLNEVGISVSPLGYRHKYEGSQKEILLEKSAYAFKELAIICESIEQQTGKYIHIDIEPEPDAVLENAAEIVSFFSNYLSKEQTFASLRRYITVCLDVCHFAVSFDDIAASIRLFKANNIKIGKVQLSSAIKLVKNEENRYDLKLLDDFIDSIYLHQVVMHRRNGDLIKLRDIVEYKYLNSAVLNQITEIRSHIHVPLFTDSYKNFLFTQEQVINILSMFDDIDCSHWEVETYTWHLLPKELKLPLVESIVRELEWVLSHIPEPESQL
jgi:hypothetical protein